MSSTTPPPPPPQAIQAQPVVYGGNASLYVGDLDPSVTEGQLYDVFSQIASVVSIRVCRDQIRRVSLGYAYVNFTNPQDASNAKENLNFTPINGKPMRIMFSHRDPSIRKSGQANIFIKNLDASIDNKALLDTFASFGTVLSCKVATDNNGQSKGYGFVQFEREEAAHNAINQLDKMFLNDKQVYVGLFVRRQERNQTNDGSQSFTNIYVKNLSETTTREDLVKIFGKCGPVNSAIVIKKDNEISRCFGFVNFDNPEDAALAVEKLNGTVVSDDKVWYVGKAQKKAEREAELRAHFEQERNGRLEKSHKSNLYIKNLDDNINDDSLKELFSEFGTIKSCKVLVDAQQQSKGFGFVAFATPEEANRALTEMNGKIIGRKPLYVALAQRKEDRKATLQAHFAQIRSPVPVLPSGMPGFHPGGPRVPPQQLFYGQSAHGFSPQPTYGFQQQLLPGIRPGLGPNFVLPYPLHRQGQPGQRIGPRRGGSSQQMQQHQRNANQGYRYMSNMRNGLDPSMVPQGIMNPMVAMPVDLSGMYAPPVDGQRPGPMPIAALASALASATPERQREMLGEQLFPLVEQLEPNNAGKVTGMLLEMDETEVLHLIESPDALKMKVGEAMDILRQTSESNAAEHLGTLSLD